MTEEFEDEGGCYTRLGSGLAWPEMHGHTKRDLELDVGRKRLKEDQSPERVLCPIIHRRRVFVVAFCGGDVGREKAGRFEGFKLQASSPVQIALVAVAQRVICLAGDSYSGFCQSWQGVAEVANEFHFSGTSLSISPSRTSGEHLEHQLVSSS